MKNKSAESVNNNEGNIESLEDELTDKFENNETSDKAVPIVRRSNRNRNQRYNDDEKDEDYQISEN